MSKGLGVLNKLLKDKFPMDTVHGGLFRNSYGSVDLWWLIQQFLAIQETWVAWGNRGSTNVFDKGDGLTLLFLPTSGHHILPHDIKKWTSSQLPSASSFLLSHMDSMQHRSNGVLGQVTSTTTKSWLSLQFSWSKSTSFTLHFNRKLRHADSLKDLGKRTWSS